MRYLGSFIVASSLSVSALFAQSTFCVSNDDFGQPGIIFLDSEDYPRTFLDNTTLLIEYTCERMLLEQAPEASPVVFMAGDETRVSQHDGNASGKIIGRYILQIGKTVTKFQTEPRYKSDSVFVCTKRRLAEGKFYTQKANYVFAHDCYYMEGRSLTFTGRLAADDFMFKETLPRIDWVIKDSLKQVCGYPCTLAEGAFRGRIYRVWFSEEIPSSAGPWKLNGLPGLILEAEDTERQISMTAVDVREGTIGIYRPEYPYVQISKKDYNKLLCQLWKDPALFQVNHTSRSSVVTVLKEDRTITSLPKIAQMETTDE